MNGVAVRVGRELLLPSGPNLCNHEPMVSATKKTGRPATGIGTPVQVRLQPDQLAKLDAWRTANGNPTRPEAVRAILAEKLS